MAIIVYRKLSFQNHSYRRLPCPWLHLSFIEIRVEGALYVVHYEVYNLDASQHVHMFFDTVPPEQAGSPGSGPWRLTWNTYGTPPFTQYGIAQRPAGAAQMCALVANSNHSVIEGSGNCVFLPE